MNDNNESDKDILVQIRDMHFSRGSRAIFKGINMDIPRGGICAIMGPSGTGKTTLLKLIGAQIKPSRGTIHFDGKNIHKLSRSELFNQRKRMGMLFQSGALLTDLSVFDNVAYPLREHTKLSERLIRHLVLTRLHAVGLRGARDLMPGELSGGMARRVALARALMLDPAMIMYDEPFTGQDPISMGVLIQLLHTVNDALDLTSIIVSHDVQETLSIADYVYIVSDGVVVEGGTPDDIRHSNSDWVQQFVNGEADGPVPFQFPGQEYAADLFDKGAQ